MRASSGISAAADVGSEQRAGSAVIGEDGGIYKVPGCELYHLLFAHMVACGGTRVSRLLHTAFVLIALAHMFSQLASIQDEFYRIHWQDGIYMICVI